MAQCSAVVLQSGIVSECFGIVYYYVNYIINIMCFYIWHAY